MKKYKNGALALVLAVSLSACGINHGDRMDYNLINSIQRGVTTEAQIRSMFGEPVSVQTNQKLGIKKLVYAYRNDDSMKKSAAGLGGAAGGLIGDNMVTAREESQMLEVDISLATGKVSDYNFTEEKNRTQSWGVNKGVSPL